MGECRQVVFQFVNTRISGLINEEETILPFYSFEVMTATTNAPVECNCLQRHLTISV